MFVEKLNKKIKLYIAEKQNSNQLDNKKISLFLSLVQLFQMSSLFINCFFSIMNETQSNLNLTIPRNNTPLVTKQREMIGINKSYPEKSIFNQ